MRIPALELAVMVNHAIREDDEWFSEPDDLERVARALAAVADIEEPVRAAGVLAFRVARAQGFAEGNKRTAFLLARWILDQNGADGARLLPASDRKFADLLVKAASGTDVEAKMVDLLLERSRGH
ncbi:MAG: Fic family protein [Acidimicrobiales bacterium]